MNLKQSRLAVLAITMLITAGTSRSQTPERVGESTVASTSIDGVIEHALANNAEIRSHEARWKAALEKIPQSSGWPDPRLSYGYFVENVETRVGPQEHRIGVMQPLPWFGRLKAAGDVASSEAAAALADLTLAQLRVIRDVKHVWIELGWLAEAMRITGDNIELVRQLEGVAQARFRAGGSLGAVTKAQVELGKLQDKLASLDDMRRPLHTRMNALLNRSPEAMPPVVSNVADGPRIVPDVETLRAWQREASPILERLEHEITRGDHAVRLARKSGMPELGIGLDYIVTGEARMPGVRDSGKDAVVAMFSMSIPLWRGKYRAMADEAEARRSAAESELESRTRQLEANLDMELYRLRDAERKTNLYGATLLPQARSALSVAQQSYESGKGDFLDLIDAQRVLLEFELELQRALSDRSQAVAAIEMLVGREMPSDDDISNSSN